MSDDHSAFTAYLAEHPRMIGVAFMVLLVLSQAGTVIAGNGGGSTGGP